MVAPSRCSWHWPLLFAGNRPTPERFAVAHDLTLDAVTRDRVAARLRRTYRGRLVGGALGFALAIAIALVTGQRLGYASGLAAILAGTLVGIALAQFVARPAPGTVRAASLGARRSADYRPRGASVALGMGLTLLLAYAVGCLATGVQGRVLIATVVSAAVGIVAVLAGVWLERRVVELSPPVGDPAAAAVDDALRSGAVRAIHHATIGIVLCATAFLGITASSWTLMQAKVDDRVVFETHGASDVVLRGGSSTPTDPGIAWIAWNDAEGNRQRRDIPGLNGYQLTGDTPISVVGRRSSR